MSMSYQEQANEIVVAMINNGFLNGDNEKRKEQVEAVCEAVAKIHEAISPSQKK